MTPIAFIGLGAMGERMARRLLDAGHELSVWNRTRSKAERLSAAGARVAATPAEAARGTDWVMTMVRDPAALRAVTGGPEGVLAGLAAGATLVEMSTVGPGAVLELAGRMPPGTGLLDGPVLGSLSEASGGTLRIFVGGEGALVERARPLLSVLGDPMHLGPLGSGAAAKLVANSTLLGALVALGEAVALGDGLGLSREALWGVLAATPLAAQAERRRPALEEGSYMPRFTLSLARKDADLILAAAAQAGIELRLVTAAGAWLVEAEEAGLGDLDYSAVLGQITRQP